MGTIEEEMMGVFAISTTTTRRIFIPSTIRQWNSLDPSFRNVDSIAKFKAELRKRKDISKVPKHYEIGPRKLNIILTQLRCFASYMGALLFCIL
jgi:hypothetical protein